MSRRHFLVQGYIDCTLLIFFRRIKKAVQMHDEIAHLRVVDGLTCLAKPGLMSRGIVGIEAHHIKFCEILEGDTAHI